MSTHEDEDVDIMFINRVAEIAVLTDNRVVPVTNWFGQMGEDCDPSEAVVCVAGSPESGWFTVDLIEQDYVTVH